MSISDGLGPSIFCRKMEKTRPMREEMDGKGVYFPPNCEEHPRSNLAQYTNVPRSQEDYIAQVSEVIEDRVTKKLSQEFNRTENRILGAFSRLDEFFLNPLIQGFSGFTPVTSRTALGTNKRTKEDESQSDPHPAARVSHSQTMQNSGPDDRYDNGKPSEKKMFILTKRFSFCNTSRWVIKTVGIFQITVLSDNSFQTAD